MDEFVADKILDAAIERYGHDKQTDIAIEEMSELTKALLKYRRMPNDGTRTNIVEEIADVDICLRQLKKMYIGDDRETSYKYVIDFKLVRLKNRLDVEGADNG